MSEIDWDLVKKNVFGDNRKKLPKNTKRYETIEGYDLETRNGIMIVRRHFDNKRDRVNEKEK